MVIDKYAKAFTEVYEIIINLDEELKKEIPENFVNFIKNNKDEQYKFKFDNKKPINEQKMSQEAKMLLSAMYEAYMATPEEKKAIIKSWKENIFKKPLEN